MKTFSSVPLLLYTVFILVLHVIPLGSGGQSRRALFRGDYIFHLILFLPWIWTVFIRYRLRAEAEKFSSTRFILMWTTIGLLLAALSEGLQLLLSYRVFNPIDLLYNVFGILIGLVLFVFWRRRRA